MSTGIDYVKELCKENGITISKLEKELGFGNGYFNPKKLKEIKYERAIKIAEYLNGDLERIMGTTVEAKYYLNDETADMAQKLFDNKDLRLLFDAAQDASPEDLKTTYDMLMALKRKERGED